MAWLSGWNKRKPIVLTGGSSGAQTDYQLELAVSHEAAMLGDFDDLRFTQADGTTLVDAWCEVKVDDTSATVWVEFPTTPANTVEQTYYMYYGKSDAASNWDGTGTFPFFEDWDNLDNWTTRLGTPSVSAGELTLNNDGLSHTMVFPEPFCVRLKAKYNTAYNAARFALFEDVWNTVTETGPYIGWLYADMKNYDGAWRDSGKNYATGIYDIIEMKNVEDEIGYTFDLMVNDVAGDANPCGYRNDKTMGMIGLYESGGSNFISDWILVRKYAANPPTYEFGAEESAPTGGNPMWYYNLLRRRNS